MNQQQLDESYFQWLHNLVADPRIEDPSLTHWNILRVLFTKEFVWIVGNDDNRAEDGKELRYEYLAWAEIEDPDPDWAELGCSVLELMVGLSRRLAFEAEGEPHYWFWVLMRNIGLEKYSDAGRLPVRKIDEVLDRVLFRTYQKNGKGGFFPLRHPYRDQRKVELWYQLSAWVLELGE